MYVCMLYVCLLGNVCNGNKIDSDGPTTGDEGPSALGGEGMSASHED